MRKSHSAGDLTSGLPHLAEISQFDMQTHQESRTLFPCFATPNRRKKSRNYLAEFFLHGLARAKFSMAQQTKCENTKQIRYLKSYKEEIFFQIGLAIPKIDQGCPQQCHAICITNNRISGNGKKPTQPHRLARCPRGWRGCLRIAFEV